MSLEVDLFLAQQKIQEMDLGTVELEANIFSMFQAIQKNQDIVAIGGAQNEVLGTAQVVDALITAGFDTNGSLADLLGKNHDPLLGTVAGVDVPQWNFELNEILEQYYDSGKAE